MLYNVNKNYFLSFSMKKPNQDKIIKDFQKYRLFIVHWNSLNFKSLNGLINNNH